MHNKVNQKMQAADCPCGMQNAIFSHPIAKFIHLGVIVHTVSYHVKEARNALYSHDFLTEQPPDAANQVYRLSRIKGEYPCAPVQDT